MKYLAYACLGLFLTTAAQAADKTDGVSSAIAVERILCRPAMVHSGNDASYKPGVDVNGNPVAAADLNAQPVMQAHYTEVPLNIDLAKKLNLSRPSEALMPVASLRIYDDGRVLYNGQDITQQANVVCGRPAGGAPPVEPKVVNSMQIPDVPLPATAAPSSTTPAR